LSGSNIQGEKSVLKSSLLNEIVWGGAGEYDGSIRAGSKMEVTQLEPWRLKILSVGKKRDDSMLWLAKDFFYPKSFSSPVLCSSFLLSSQGLDDLRSSECKFLPLER
jgi:hypothetical protein